MAFSFSNLFKSKEKAKEETTPPPPPPAVPGAPKPPPVPLGGGGAAPPQTRISRVAMPNSVQAVSMRETSSLAGSPVFSAAPPPVPGATNRPVPFPSMNRSFAGSTPDETVVPDFAPSAPPPPEPEQVAPDITIALEMGDFIDRIPAGWVNAGAVDRRRQVRFEAADLFSDLSKGRASIPLSRIAAVAPDIFLRPVTATEDAEIPLPLQKLVEQMAPSFRTRADQVVEAVQGQIETPFLQVALEDQARMPAKVAAAPPAPVMPPAPTFAQGPKKTARISVPPVAPPVPVAPPGPVAPAGGSYRPTTGPVPLAAMSPVEAQAAPGAGAPAPIIADAAPVGKRLPSTVRASVAGGKIRLSGPSLPTRPPAPPPTGTPPRAATGPVPTVPSATRPAGLQPPPTAQTAKKTARIQLPPIALRSGSSSAASAPPPYKPAGQPTAPPPPPPSMPMPPAPSLRAPQAAPVPAFKTPAVIAPPPAPLAPPPPPLAVAPPPAPLPPVEASPLTPPPVPGGRSPISASHPAIRTTILKPSMVGADSVPSAPPLPPPAPEAPPVSFAPPPARAVPPPAREVPPVHAAMPAPAPAPAFPPPVPAPAPAPAAPPPLRPVAFTPPAPPAPAPLAAAAPAADGKSISMSLAAIMRGLPATSLGADMPMVADAVRVTFPFQIVESQLAMGRVTIPRDTFLEALPGEVRNGFAANCDLASIPIPLQEVFQNLPMAALARRADQIVEETGPEIPTPFGAKAAEDAKRLPPPAPAPVAPPPAPEPEPEPMVAEAFPEELEEPEPIATVSEPEPEPEPEPLPLPVNPPAPAVPPALTAAPRGATGPIPIAPVPITPISIPPLAVPPPVLPPVSLPKPADIPAFAFEETVTSPRAKVEEEEEHMSASALMPIAATTAPTPAVPPPVAAPAIPTPAIPTAPLPVPPKLPPKTAKVDIAPPEPPLVPVVFVSEPEAPRIPEVKKVAPLAPAAPPPVAVEPKPPVEEEYTPIPVMVRIEPAAPPAPVAPPIAPVAEAKPLPPPVTPPPVAPTPVAPPAVPAAPAPVQPPAPAPAAPRSVATTPMAVAPPPLKPAALEDPIRPEPRHIPPAPVSEPEATEVIDDEPRQPGLGELQAIFMTDETLDAKKVVRLVAKLPGITACTIMFADGLTLAGNFPKELDGEGFSAMSPLFYKRANQFASELHLGEMQTFSFYTDRSVLSFFMKNDICLAVMQTGRGFLPGVREKLMAVTTELSKMYARAASH